MTSLVVRREIGVLKLVPVGCRVISEGVVVKERVQVICPACGQRVEAVASDGRVKGYCTVARQPVDFLIETQLENEYRAKLSAAIKKRWQIPEYRAKQSAAQERRWQDPEFRAKMTTIRNSRRPVEDLP
ncbi:MAG TPA: hypothetical protein VMV84_04975 [Dehalococcoidales bacterium]|nr:hypothetical protein [Dehalococcoidales bacterium]